MIAILGIIYCLGAYLVFIKFRLIRFTLFWQIVVGIVGFFGLLTILYSMNYTRPFSIGGTVSGLATQIEARVPGKVIEVNVKDNASVKKGDEPRSRFKARAIALGFADVVGRAQNGNH